MDPRKSRQSVVAAMLTFGMAARLREISKIDSYVRSKMEAQQIAGLALGL